MTALDEALVISRQDPEKSMVFYNLFFNTSLFFPLRELPKELDPQIIDPILIENEGRLFLMLFDEKARLATWAKREVACAQMPGHAIVEMLEPNIRFVLNAGTEHYHEFVEEEIAWLKGLLKKPEAT